MQESSAWVLGTPLSPSPSPSQRPCSKLQQAWPPWTATAGQSHSGSLSLQHELLLQVGRALPPCISPLLIYKLW